MESVLYSHSTVLTERAGANRVVKQFNDGLC